MRASSCQRRWRRRGARARREHGEDGCEQGPAQGGDRRSAVPPCCSGRCSGSSSEGAHAPANTAVGARLRCGAIRARTRGRRRRRGRGLVVLVLVRIVAVELVLVVERIVVVALGAVGACELEALDEIVAPVLVERRVLGDLGPTRRGRSRPPRRSRGRPRRVVDDDHDLRLRVEIRCPGGGSARRAGSGGRASSRVYTPTEGVTARPSHGSQLVERARRSRRRRQRLLALAQASFVARLDELAHLGDQRRIALGGARLASPSSFATSASMSSAGSPRCDAAVAAGAQHLAHLLLLLGARRGGVERGGAPARPSPGSRSPSRARPCRSRRTSSRCRG